MALHTSGIGCLSFAQASIIWLDITGGAWCSAGVNFLVCNPQTSESHPSRSSPSGISCNCSSDLSRFLQNSILSGGTPALGYLAASAVSFGRSNLKKSAAMKFGLPSGVLFKCICICEDMKIWSFMFTYLQQHNSWHPCVRRPIPVLHLTLLPFI